MNDTSTTPSADSTNQPQPQQPLDRPPVAAKSTSSRLPWIILVITVLVLGGLIGWLVLQLQSTNTRLSSSERELASVKTNDSSAADATEPADSDNPDAPVSTDTDENQIISTAIGWGTARAGSEDAKLNVTITKKQMPFVDVSVGVEGGSGYGCTLKKSNDVWLVLFCGQNTPSQAVLDEWGIPASFAKSDY